MWIEPQQRRPGRPAHSIVAGQRFARDIEPLAIENNRGLLTVKAQRRSEKTAIGTNVDGSSTHQLDFMGQPTIAAQAPQDVPKRSHNDVVNDVRVFYARLVEYVAATGEARILMQRQQSTAVAQFQVAREQTSALCTSGAALTRSATKPSDSIGVWRPINNPRWAQPVRSAHRPSKRLPCRNGTRLSGWLNVSGGKPDSAST